MCVFNDKRKYESHHEKTNNVVLNRSDANRAVCKSTEDAG